VAARQIFQHHVLPGPQARERAAVTANLSVSPAATEEEVAAIVAALHAATPRFVITVEEQHRRDAAWRFSGRWWARPTAIRRDRPFR
jgi:hypothetical protein